MQQVEVYMNIRKFNKGKPFWSIRDKRTGRVIGHEKELVLTNCWFTVQQSGRDRVRREEKKNVHAWVNGEVVTELSSAWVYTDRCNEDHYRIESDSKRVSYNPYTHDHFEIAPHGQEIASAETVHLSSNGNIYVYGSFRIRRN